MRRDAGLTPGEEADFQTWLAADPAHRAAFAQWETTWSKLDAPFAAGQADDLMALLEQRAARRRRRGVASVAAGFAVLLGCAVFWQTTVASRPVTEPARAAMTTFWRPGKQMLPDGSVVELNRGAKIEANYTSAVRRVTLLAGEAHFEVKADAARPFLVEAGGVAVRAVGTAFSVTLEQNSVAVLVTHGRVTVSPERREEKGDPIASATPSVGDTPLATLDVDQRVVVDLARQPVASGVTTLPTIEREGLLAWRAPRVEFTGVALAEAVKLLNRESAGHRGARFVIADPALEGVRISGLFRLDNTEAFVRLLDQGFGIAAESREGAEIVLRRAP